MSVVLLGRLLAGKSPILATYQTRVLTKGSSDEGSLQTIGRRVLDLSMSPLHRSLFATDIFARIL